MCGIEIRGTDDPGVQVGAVGGGNGDEFGPREAQGRQAVLKLLVVREGAHTLAVGVAERLRGRHTGFRIGVQIVRVGRVEAHPVAAGGPRDAL